MITSSAAADCSVAMAMVSLAQRWCGSSTPVNMLGTNELHLLEPLDAAAPQAAHMFLELRKLGYKAAVGWVVRPPIAGDGTIYGAYMQEAGDTVGRTEVAIARLQRWRREHNVMWVSELFRADGITLRDRFMFNLAASARRCEPDAIRLCGIAFGRGRGPANKSARPRVGLPTIAARDVVGVGSYVWHDGALGRVRSKGHAGATIAVFTVGATPRRITARTGVRFTMRSKRGGSLRLTAAPGRHCLADHIGSRTRSLPRDPGPPRCRDPRPLPSRSPLRGDLLCCPRTRRLARHPTGRLKG